MKGHGAVLIPHCGELQAPESEPKGENKSLPVANHPTTRLLFFRKLEVIEHQV